jgi:glycine cleavage system H protein
MNINGFEFPEDLLYYPEEHVWIRVEGDTITVGITSLGQYMAGKIFQVTVKKPGEKVTSRSVLFSVESPKWVGKFSFLLREKWWKSTKGAQRSLVDKQGSLRLMDS